VEKYSRATEDKDDNKIRCMRFACLTTKATVTHTYTHIHTHTHIHSEYVILIAFPRQQWLGESDSKLPFYVVACLV